MKGAGITAILDKLNFNAKKKKCYPKKRGTLHNSKSLRRCNYYAFPCIY